MPGARNALGIIAASRVRVHDNGLDVRPRGDAVFHAMRKYRLVRLATRSGKLVTPGSAPLHECFKSDEINLHSSGKSLKPHPDLRRMRLSENFKFERSSYFHITPKTTSQILLPSGLL